ncbi:MAG: sulfite exporter TauE/SafE family protein [Sphingobacterium sp.]
MIIIGCILAILVGLTLGLVGSGGTILTVPILVYVMGVDPVLSTTYSLFAIGLTSGVGGLRGIFRKEVDLNKVWSFGIPSLVVVFITRSFVLPLVPETIVIAGYPIAQRVLLMILFSIIMIASSLSMIRSAQRRLEVPTQSHQFPIEIIILQGALVGLVTGAMGAGGGFLIIPALVNFYHLPMRRAVSTSLVIISINSFFGLAGDFEKFPTFDWVLLGGYTLGATIGLAVGLYFADRIPGHRLKAAFGYVILLVGLYVLCNEIVLGQSAK